MPRCDFCGKEYSVFDVNYCNEMQGESATICGRCATAFKKHSASNRKDLRDFVMWCKSVLDNNQIKNVYYYQISDYYHDAVERLSKMPQDNDIFNQETNNTTSFPAVTDGYTEFPNIWVTICKVMGYLGILIDVIIGAIIGHYLDHIIIGGLVGAFVGAFGCALFMMMVSLCEDVSAIRKRIEKSANVQR